MEGKKKIKENKKIELNLTYYFHLLLQTNFIYFKLSIKILNNLRIYMFLISNFIHI